MWSGGKEKGVPNVQNHVCSQATARKPGSAGARGLAKFSDAAGGAKPALPRAPAAMGGLDFSRDSQAVGPAVPGWGTHLPPVGLPEHSINWGSPAGSVAGVCWSLGFRQGRVRP